MSRGLVLRGSSIRRGRPRRLVAAATVLVVTLLGISAAAAGTQGTVPDDAGDVIDGSGQSVAAPNVDMTSVTANFLTSTARIDIVFAAPYSIQDGLLLLGFISPYGGGGSLVLVASPDLLGPTPVNAINSDGSEGSCADSSVTGDGTTTITLTLLPACLNPPDETTVWAGVFDMAGNTDVTEATVYLQTEGSGPPTVTGLYDGDPATTEPSTFNSPIDVAVASSQALYPDGYYSAVLVRDDLFADALAGSPLLSLAGPLLYTGRDALPPQTRTELDRLLDAGSEVVVLGGPSAVGDSVLAELTSMGLQPRRIQGANRIATSLAIAAEVADYGYADAAIFVRSAGPPGAENGTAAWADSVSIAPYAAGRQTPVLLVSDTVTPAHLSFLDQNGIEKIYLIGGTAAVPEQVQLDLDAHGYQVQRVSGSDRAGTAVEIARLTYESGSVDFAPHRDVTTGRPHAVAVLNGYARDSWAYGLASAAVAATEGVPYVIVGPNFIPDASTVLLTGCDARPVVEIWMLGRPTHVSDEVFATLDTFDGDGCP